MSDTASESGSSSCDRQHEEATLTGPQATGTAAASGTTKEEVGGNVPGKLMEESGAVGGAGATAGTAAVSSIERLLQQQRNEIMFELRRLQLGDRPVTGQGHKEAVESFFTSQQDGGGEGGEEHRPETVHVEVRALAESRPVSSLLHSVRFRRSLESALRTAIGSRSPPPPRPAQSSQSPRPAPRPRSSLAASQASQPRGASPLSHTPSPPTISSASSSSRGFVPIPPPPPPIEGLISGEQEAEAMSPPTYQNTPQQQTAQQHQTAQQQQSAQQQAYPAQWLLHNVPSVSEQRILGGWEQLEEMQREDFIHEISDLVQRQLVTQSLGGNFRNTLENMMQARVAAAGDRGEQTLRFIRSLQPSVPHQRNDFSELGIPTAPLDASLDGALEGGAASDPLDDVSVISATAAVTVQASQQQVLMRREMRSLKAQMQEMAAMLKTCVDMQLETQRAIRQEVAAALAQQAPTTAVRPPAPVSDAGTCVVCVAGAADTVLYRCGHLCVCHGCGVELRRRGHHCPVCRAPIDDIVRAYKSGGAEE